LAAVRQQQMERKENPGYDGHCRDRNPEEVRREIEQGAPGVVRLKTPRDGETHFADLLRGEITIANTEVDDQVLVKSDGFPTYHLANVVDDHLMSVTHVIRGEEWISSTPKHVLLYDAFGWDKPAFAHLPLLRNADKSKVSKRKNPVSLSFYRQAGYLPDVMVNFLGMMAFTFEDGREIFSLQDFVEHFTLHRISLGGPVFDQAKLLWLNGRYLREKRSEAEFVGYLRERLFDDAYLAQVVTLVKERVEKSEDFVAYAPYFFTGEVEAFDAAELIVKGRDKKESLKIWEELAERMDRCVEFRHDQIEEFMRAQCTDLGLKPKDYFMPVRLMVTGRKATPPLFETMSVLGRERCRHRVRRGVEALKAFQPKG
ncbi:MAG: glutamate--tRNA ligase, partial [Myxococcota bacterium]